MDFDTFAKSDYRAVKVKACEAVKKSKKLLKFVQDDGKGGTEAPLALRKGAERICLTDAIFHSNDRHRTQNTLQCIWAMECVEYQ